MPGTTVDLAALLVESTRAFNEYRSAHPDEAVMLQGVNLEGCDIAGADLRRANLFEANLAWSNLEGTNFEGADLRRSWLEGWASRALPAARHCASILSHAQPWSATGRSGKAT